MGSCTILRGLPHALWWHHIWHPSGIALATQCEIRAILGARVSMASTRKSSPCAGMCCLLRLVSLTVSESRRIIFPTPARAIISAAYAPTPPSPMTATEALRSFAIPSSPPLWPSHEGPHLFHSGESPWHHPGPAPFCSILCLSR